MTRAIGGVAMIGVVLSVISGAWAKELPAQADLRAKYEKLGLTPKDQDGRGCCSLFAVVGVLEFEYARKAKGAEPLRLSEEYLNWASHQSNGRDSDGSFFSDAVRGVRMFGICREKLMPYAAEYHPEEKPSKAAMADAQGRRDIGARWIKQWDVKTGMTAEMIAEIKAEIASGHPVACGMRWPKKDTMNHATHVLGMPAPVDDVFDGHSVVYVGYRDDASQPGGGVFVFRNSGGPKYEADGYAYLPYAYAALYVNDAVGLRVGAGKPIEFNTAGAGAVEAETLEVVASKGCSAAVQDMTPWGAAAWSGGKQLVVGADYEATLTVAVTVKGGGTYAVELWATKAPDYGKVKVSVDGKAVGKVIDLYDGEVVPTGKVPVGEVELAEGRHEVEFKVTGRNKASAGWGFGLDCVGVVPVR